MQYTSKLILTLLAAAMGLSACVPSMIAREQTARHIAGPAFMMDRELQAGQFVLTLYERAHKRGAPAHVYIEGDDVRTGINPTPKTPIGLNLAAMDKAENVIYIARPCQYSQRSKTYLKTPMESESCEVKKYTGSERFSPEVISSMSSALDDIKRRYNITSFHIYGHSGGGTIGALLAAQRHDILSLTTIAGNLDHTIYSDALQQKPKSKHKSLDGSLNAKDVAPQLANLPQFHYIGGDDDTMPPAVLHSYLAAIGPTNCVQYQMIQENGYTEGWVEKWPELLKNTPTCKGEVKPVLMTQ